MRRAAAGFALVVSLAIMGVLCAQGPARSGKKPPAQYDKSITDAFFEDVRTARGEGQPGGGRVRAPATDPGKTQPDTPSVPMPGSGSGWSKLISAEVLEDLIKAAPSEIGDKVDNESRFNTGHRDIRKLYTTLAVAFNVIGQYDGNVRFKDKAAGLREQFARSARNCKTFSTGAWKEALQRSRDLQEIIRGGNVAMPEAEPQTDFSKVADVSEIMKRLEDGVDKGIEKMSADEAGFKTNSDKLLRESQIVAMLARALQDPTYDNGGDDVYLGFARRLETGALEVAEGVRQNNYRKASTGVSEMKKACTECHGSYR